MRIVYVEDNAANVALVERVAKLGHHDTIWYSTAEEALAGLAKDNPDLILVDVQLSGAIDGLELVKRLRANGVRVPIIAVTAYAMVGDRDKCLAAGCTDYIPKPVSIRQLVSVIKEYARSKG